MCRPSIVAMAALALSAVACESNDIGEACPQLLTDEQRANLVVVHEDGTSTVVETYGTSAAYPCDELLCVASQGRDGYCTKECRSDTSCPDGFECRSVSGGAFARDLCTWKSCTTDEDCGDKGKFVCRTVEGVFPGEDFRLCDFKD